MNLRSAIVTQLRVLFALLMREMATRYGGSAGGYVWAILDPVGFILLMTAVFSEIAHAPPIGESFALFYAIGYMAFHFYFDISNVVGTAVQFNKPLMSFPSVTLLDAVIARFILQVLTCCFVTLIVLGSLLLLVDDQIAIDPAPILSALGLAALLGLGVGAANSVLFAYSQAWMRMFNIVNRPLFIVSGIFFTFESLPRAGQDILWWNPLIHITALMRSGFYPVYKPDFVSEFYVLLFALTPLMLGVLLLRALRAEILES